jgi:ATP-binding cassette, subfamily B (MDR/TAP), member 1
MGSGSHGDVEKTALRVDTDDGLAKDGKTPETAKDPKARPEREAEFKDYLRIFSYAAKWDILLMVGAALASIGAGVTMPLMNIVFGKLVANFNNYFGANAQTEEEFNAQVNRQSLYMFALFIARFGLNYINKVRTSLGPSLHPQRCLLLT